MATKEQFVVNENGERTAVLLDVEYYRELLAALEEIESIRAYDEAKPHMMMSFPSVRRPKRLSDSVNEL